MSRDRPPLNPKQIREQAKQAMAVHGLAAKHLVPSIVHGAVFTAKDEAITFPESRLAIAGKRDLHVFRRVILIQGPAFLKTVSPKTLLVIPVTYSISEKALLQPYEVDLPTDEPGFDPGRKVALVNLLQPILKSDLDQAKGVLRPLTLKSVLAAVASMLGLLSSTAVEVSPRPTDPK